LRLAASTLGDRADAEDVFQTVFLRLFSSGKRFTDDEHMKAWLLRVTINCCKDELKGARRQRVVPLETASVTPLASMESTASASPTTEGQTSQSVDGRIIGTDFTEVDSESDTGERLQLALAELPGRQREALHLFYHDGYSTDEIAAIMEEKPSTVRSRLHRARQSLKTKLGEHDE
jgi:RNA polymerase sigma-70 factor (ECF subfamily)